MACAVCSSLNEVEFITEMMIHFSGPDHKGKPGVLVYATIWVCLDCGAARFNTPTKDLRLLRESATRSGAA